MFQHGVQRAAYAGVTQHNNSDGIDSPGGRGIGDDTLTTQVAVQDLFEEILSGSYGPGRQSSGYTECQIV
jgi:hypothetical protein